MRSKIFILFYFYLTVICQAATIYVDSNAIGNNDGSTWTDAYNYLQDALAHPGLNSGDEIWVAKGVYTPDSNSAEPNGTGDRNASFVLINGVTLKGGYAGFGEADPNVRDLELYESILSGDLDGDDVDVNDPLDLLTEPTRAENSYHVVFGGATNATAVLDGFIITAGNADGASPDYFGGGMTTRYSASQGGSPTVINCTFRGNTAYLEGGGMYHRGSSTLTGCTFIDNSTDGFYGGGIYITLGSPTLNNCVFTQNSSYWDGGAVFSHSSDITVNNCSFVSNTARNSFAEGGGMYGFYSSLTLNRCSFRDNWAKKNGGGISIDSSDLTPTDCNFTDNDADERGGGIYSTGGSSDLTLTNCSFQGNATTGPLQSDGGGAMYNNGSNSATLESCVFSENESHYHGGAIFNYDCNTIFTNCMFNGNNTSMDGGGMYCLDSTPSLTNCTFIDNEAVNELSSGGGMCCSNSDAVLYTCTFIDNWGTSGAGLSCISSSPALNNCTFISNIAEREGATGIDVGGGVGCFENSNPIFTNCTLIDNEAGNNGGGIYCDVNSTPELTGTVVCRNEPNEIAGSFTDNGDNIISKICPPVRPLGDLDGNRVVDFFDFAVMAAHWLECTAVHQSECW